MARDLSRPSRASVVSVGDPVGQRQGAERLAQRLGVAVAQLGEIGVVGGDPAKRHGSSEPGFLMKKSMGAATPMFERMVASKESSAIFTASLRVSLQLTVRSRIGLPYLFSPICR